MKRRTPQNWQLLIKQQSESDLSVLDFCKQQKISTSCFYKHKALNQTNVEPQTNSFIKIERPQQTTQKIEPIKLQHGKTRIHLPATIQPVWLASFVKALS